MGYVEIKGDNGQWTPLMHATVKCMECDKPNLLMFMVVTDKWLCQACAGVE